VIVCRILNTEVEIMSKREHQAPARVLHIDLVKNTMAWSFVDEAKGAFCEVKARSRKWPRVLGWLFKVPKKR